jgi:hypothetical protein
MYLVSRTFSKRKPNKIKLKEEKRSYTQENTEHKNKRNRKIVPVHLSSPLPNSILFFSPTVRVSSAAGRHGGSPNPVSPILSFPFPFPVPVHFPPRV